MSFNRWNRSVISNLFPNDYPFLVNPPQDSSNKRLMTISSLLVLLKYQNLVKEPDSSVVAFLSRYTDYLKNQLMCLNNYKTCPLPYQNFLIKTSIVSLEANMFEFKDLVPTQPCLSWHRWWNRGYFIRSSVTSWTLFSKREWPWLEDSISRGAGGEKVGELRVDPTFYITHRFLSPWGTIDFFF